MPPRSKRTRDNDTAGAFQWAGEWHSAVVGRRAKQRRAVLPAVGDLVTCRVQCINIRQATVEILVVGEVPLPEPCSGLIRREDVRAVGGDPVEVHRSFRPARGRLILLQRRQRRQRITRPARPACAVRIRGRSK